MRVDFRIREIENGFSVYAIPEGRDYIVPLGCFGTLDSALYTTRAFQYRDAQCDPVTMANTAEVIFKDGSSKRLRTTLMPEVSMMPSNFWLFSDNIGVINLAMKDCVLNEFERVTPGTITDDQYAVVSPTPKVHGVYDGVSEREGWPEVLVIDGITVATVTTVADPEEREAMWATGIVYRAPADKPDAVEAARQRNIMAVKKDPAPANLFGYIYRGRWNHYDIYVTPRKFGNEPDTRRAAIVSVYDRGLGVVVFELRDEGMVEHTNNVLMARQLASLWCFHELCLYR